MCWPKAGVRDIGVSQPQRGGGMSPGIMNARPWRKSRRYVLVGCRCGFGRTNGKALNSLPK